MMHGRHVQEFQVLRVLEPTLRMKAQVDSNIRGQKDFICREEKRKTAYWRMQQNLETGDPVGQGREWGFIGFLCIGWGQRWLSGADRGCLDHLLLFGTSAVSSLVLH
jgi:hypothetical protein